METSTFLNFAVDNGYLEASTVCSGILPKDYVENPAHVAYQKYLDKLDDRSLFKKMVDYVFA